MKYWRHLYQSKPLRHTYVRSPHFVFQQLNVFYYTVECLAIKVWERFLHVFQLYSNNADSKIVKTHGLVKQWPKLSTFLKTRRDLTKIHMMTVYILIYHIVRLRQVWNFFSSDKTEGNAINSRKLFVFAIMMTKIVKIYIAHILMFSYHTLNLEIFYLEFVFPVENKGLWNK